MARSVAPRRPAISIGTSTFSNAVSDGIKWKNWNTNPIDRPRNRASASSPRLVMAVPSMRISPVVGASSPAINPSSVLLPLPDGPTMARLRPAGMVRSRGWRMVSGDPPLSTVFETPCSSIMRSRERA